MQFFYCDPSVSHGLKLGLDTDEKERVCVCVSFFFFFEHFMTVVSHQWIQCTVYETHKLFFSATFSLKISPTVLFTHLKIILLQYFQFLVLSKISDIQTYPKCKLIHVYINSSATSTSTRKSSHFAIFPLPFFAIGVLFS